MSESWLDTLPEELRGEATLKTVPDVPTLAKNYVEAQRMMGGRIPAPQQGWEQKQWDDFYNKAGRPESPDKYTMPEVKLEEGVKLDDEKLKGLRAKVHGLGLSDRQFKGIMEVYLGSVNDGVKGTSAQIQAERDASLGALKTEWGDQFDAKLDVAKSVLKKFGGEDTKLMEYLETSRLGNNVEFIKFLNSLGSGMLEDTTRGGSLGAGLQIQDKARAMDEIKRLTMDGDFMKAYNDAQNTGHEAAVNRWLQLHSIAYPGKSS
jgi:hypothetical protein